MRPRSFTLRAAILLSMLFVVGCDTMSTEPAPEPLTELPRALSQSERVIIDAGNRFAVDLLRQVHTAAPDSTVFLSPLSASMALGMTMNGAAGETLDQMRETLGFGALSLTEINDSYHDLIELLRSLDPRVDVRLANAIFHRDRFQIETSFLNATRSAFDAEVRGLDFDDPGSVGVINAWVKTATANRIDEIIEAPIHPLTMAFLINAIYFNGDWTQAFDAADTRPAPFRLPDGSSSTVQMMGLELETLPYRNGPGWVATELPYGNGAWVMTVAVPTGNSGLAAVVDDLESILDPTVKWHDGEINVFLPRFELEWERLLNEDLKALGMVDAFDPDVADFTPMCRTAIQDGLHIAKVKQKTFLKVDEKGTEAAAVTVVEMRNESASPTVAADRPFFLAIRERLSGTVLFAGLIVQPPTD